ncbi:hybrid sensor histidine kinase/response regulator [Vibrio hannami]|uniref:hybrid sensor histidine kinase/response regulator n=1 Tax=Vibrio hannami TaxID=2717094 RepID=UPI00240ECADA|nr:hybrid sensor histidine kinase/response regulator [Vibrio hannami]MDG3085624.1 hybrid sensor histidine kinase/response regulator [Vibrio hannami]
MGVVGFPLYYLVWQHFVPQPYENLLLRLSCSVLFLVLVYRNSFKARIRRQMHWFYLVIITIGLPFFFFYMLLMNDWSQVWVMSFMSAIFLHILLVHITWIMFAQTIIGVGLATFCAWVAKGFTLDIAIDFSQLPVFIFTYLFGSLCFNRYQVDYDSKVALAKSFGAGIAHEMRNPLSSLSTSIDVIQSTIPNEKAKKEGHYLLSAREVDRLREVTDESMRVIQAGNETIDLLLTSIDENRISRTTFQKYSAQEVVMHAIDSFAYKTTSDRAAVFLKVQQEFEFFGSDNLLKYVMFNLLKNAFYHRGSDEFSIHISLTSYKGRNAIVVRDTGSGMTPVVLKNIFNDFYTTGKSGRYGLGLPFCKRVMRSFGGDIQCRSEVGKWTEFTLHLPLLDSNAIKEIKAELVKSKSVLLVNERKELGSVIHSASYNMGFNLLELDVETTLNRHEYDFEYDVIILDIATASRDRNAIDALESLWTFTNAHIVYLYGEQPIQRYTKPGQSPIWLNSDKFASDLEANIEALMFDADSIKSEKLYEPPISDIKRTIMVVDDNESLRRFTAVLLEKEGFEVLEQENGAKALEVLDAVTVDLILMDIEMPVMDGIETTARIRNSNKDFASIPIIAHTGDNSHDMLSKIDATYMSDYLLKPAGKNQLLSVISNWI